VPSLFNMPQYAKRLSTFILMAAQGPKDNLVNDMALPQGGVNDDNLFGAEGTGTTNATAGTTQAITHGLGVTPSVSDIILTPMSNGVVYLDPNNPPTTTTFNVLGSAASLSFAWKVITNGPGNS
jgi:hypothetical protein